MIDAAFLETLVRESPDPVVVLRSNRTIEALNPALERVARAARPGVDFMNLVSKAAHERVLGLLVRAAAGDEQLIEVPHPNGEDEAVVEWRFFPCDGGRVAGLGRVRATAAGAEGGAEMGRVQEQLKAQAGMLDRIQLELTQVPFIDPVTGVWNRMQVIERLTGEWSRTERYGSPISCLIVEVETAANVRRSEGAALADEVLKTVARRIKGVVRDHDVVGRYGGDRFVIVAVHSDAEGARALGGRIRDQAGREPVTAAGRRHPVVLRIGGATNRSEGVEILEDLFSVAESALADAKQADEPVRIASELGV